MKKKLGAVLLVFGVIFLIFGLITNQQSRNTINVVEKNCKPAYIDTKLGFTGGSTFDCQVYSVLSDIQSRQATQFCLIGLALVCASLVLFFSKK